MIKGRFLQYVAAISASILASASGIGLTWSAPILIQLAETDSPIGVTLTQNEVSWVSSLLLVGTVFGNAMLGYAINTFGRRGTLLIAAFPTFVGWIMILLARSVPLLLCARFLLGVVSTIPIAVSALYIGEITEPSIRGTLTLFCMVAMELGNVLAIVIGPYSYSAIAIIGAVVPVIFFISFYFMPETPYYYLRKKQDDLAEAALLRLRNGDSVKEEFKQMKESVDESMKNEGTLADIFKNRAYRKALLIVIVLNALSHLSGGIAVHSYMNQIFEMSNTGLDPDISAMVVIMVPFPLMFVTSVLVDKFGRKLLYYISTVGTAISMLFIAIFFYMQQSNSPYMSSVGWLPVTGVFMSYIFKSIAIAGMPFLILSEIFPPSVKGVASPVSLVFGSIFAVIVNLSFPEVSATFGLATSFLCFAISCLLGLLFVIFFLPETKGKTFSEIQEVL